MKNVPITSRYDVAEHLRTPKEMAAYFDACLEEANGDVAFIAKALARTIHEGSSRARADAREPGAWSREGGRRTLCSTLTD